MTSRTHDARATGAMTARPGVTSEPGHQPVSSMPRGRRRALPAAAIWGAVWGLIQAVSPLAFWWLEPRTVYALGLTLIAAVYIGFSVADGRPKVIAAESSVAGFFVVIAAASASGSAWLLVLGLAGHGLKDLWQTPHSIRPGHALVATVLRHGRLGRRWTPLHRDIAGNSLPWLGGQRRHPHAAISAGSATPRR